MNDNDKQGSRSDIREAELYVTYVLSDSLTLQNLNHLAIFPWDRCIPYLKLESKFRLLNSDVLPLIQLPLPEANLASFGLSNF